MKAHRIDAGRGAVLLRCAVERSGAREDMTTEETQEKIALRATWPQIGAVVAFLLTIAGAMVGHVHYMREDIKTAIYPQTRELIDAHARRSHDGAATEADLEKLEDRLEAVAGELKAIIYRLDERVERALERPR